MKCIKDTVPPHVVLEEGEFLPKTREQLAALFDTARRGGAIAVDRGPDSDVYVMRPGSTLQMVHYRDALSEIERRARR